jgi:2-phosphosulfolactate phosphatase
MQIVITDFVAGARSARGIAVVIDVFRAFSLAAHAFAAGASTIYPVAEIDAARALKRSKPDCLLLGERYAVPPENFDGGNSPAQLARWNLQGREIIHSTHAGTQGLMNAMQADEVLTGALVNVAAIVRYIRQRRPDVVTLVRMGFEAQQRCEEDDFCAEVLATRLGSDSVNDESFSNESVHIANAADHLRGASAARKFFDPACSAFAPEGDFTLCTQLDRFDFVLRLNREFQPWRLQRVDV